MNEPSLCRHCRTPFVPNAARRDFCCAGCQFVFGLLHERGLEEFYRYGDAIAPPSPEVFKAENFSWLDDLQLAEEGRRSGPCELTLDVQGISCAACLWLLEHVFVSRAGALSCQANSVEGTVKVRWSSGALRLSDYAADMRKFGYFLGPLAKGTVRRSGRDLVVRLGLCGALALNAMLFSLPLYLGLDPRGALGGLFLAVAAFIASLSMLVGGTYFFRRALGVLRSGVLHIDLPIALGLVAAYAGSLVAWVLGWPSFAYFDFIAIFTFLMLAGRWVQERAVDSNRARLLQSRVDPGHYPSAAGGEAVPHQALRRGAAFLVEPERLVPVRARLVAGAGTVGLSWITGEPHPRPVSVGDILPSGARSYSPGPLTVEAMEDWDDSQLARLLAVDSSPHWRNEAMQTLIRTYLLCVFLVAALGFAGWLAFTGNWVQAMQVLVSVLVVSCPCSIGVALPLLDDLSAARLQHEGIYVREGTLWARLRRVRHVVFDKTGTLTLENLALADRKPLDDLSGAERAVVLRMVRDSLHPVATCLREVLLADRIQAPEGGAEAVETPGFGIEWHWEGNVWRLGRAAWALADAPKAYSGATVLACDGVLRAALQFREEIRPFAVQQIRALRAAGCDVSILSGDHPDRVAAMAEKLGLPAGRAHGGLTPAEKAARVGALGADQVMMIGDGANDSLAFDAALCRGTPVVTSGLLEQKADFYLLGRSLAGLEPLLRTAKLHGRVSRRVFTFAVAYNSVAILCALAGLMNPLVAAIIMPLSSLASLSLVLAGTSKRKPLPSSTSFEPTYANA